MLKLCNLNKPPLKRERERDSKRREKERVARDGNKV